MRAAALVALAGLAALAALAVVGRAPGPAALSESTALAMAEADFAPAAGARAAGLAEAHRRRSAALLEQLPDLNINFAAPSKSPSPPRAAKAPAAPQTVDKAAEGAATKLVDEAFARAMADAAGKPVRPVKAPVPVFAATWEPKPPAAKKVQAAKHLEAKAAQLAKGPGDFFKEADKDVQQLAAEAKLPSTVAAPHPAAPKAAAAVSALASAPAVGAKAPDAAAHPVYWMQALGLDDDDTAPAGPGGLKLGAADAKAHAARGAPPAGGDRSEWLKALNRGMSATGGNAAQDAKRPTGDAQWKKALTRPMSVAQGAPQALATKKPEAGHAKATEHAAPRPEPARKAPVQPVLAKPVTGEALLSDWMQALGLGPSQNEGLGGLKLAAAPKPEPLAAKKQEKAAAKPASNHAKAAEGPVHRPVFAAHWEPAPKAAAPAAVTRKVHAQAAKTGVLAEWFAALHRKPESMFQSFADGGDGRRTAEAIMHTEKRAPVRSAVPQQEHEQLRAQKARAVTRVASNQQQLAAKGAWAKALGGDAAPAARPVAQPQVGTDMWGDVLVHVNKPMVPDAALVPDGVTPSRIVAAAAPAPLEAAAKVGDKGDWMKALHHGSQFKVAQAGRASMLASAPQHIEGYSTAIMRQALEEGESPRAVALEHATSGVIRDPFGDKAVPAEQAAFRTLWNN